MDIVGAGIIIEDISRNILVSHRKAEVSEGNKWGIPGGMVIENMSPIGTAVTKTKKEVGVEVVDKYLTFLDKFNYLAEGNNVTFYVWIYKLEVSKPKIVINTDGHDGYKWKKASELYQQKDLMVGMYPILEKYLQLK